MKNAASVIACYRPHFESKKDGWIMCVDHYLALQSFTNLDFSNLRFFLNNFSDSLQIWPMLSQRLLEPLRPRLHFLSPWTYLKRKMEWIKEYLGKTFEVVLYICLLLLRYRPLIYLSIDDPSGFWVHHNTQGVPGRACLDLPMIWPILGVFLL